MAKETDSSGEIPIQSDLARIAADGVDVTSVIALLGYIGPSSDDGVVRLHPRLGDLSVSIDIDASDIVLTREAPASTLPLGGVVVWLSRTADVTVRRTRTITAKAQDARQLFSPGSATGSGGQSGDRLNIRFGQDRVPPVYDCKDCQSKECGGSSHCMTPCQSFM